MRLLGAVRTHGPQLPSPGDGPQGAGTQPPMTGLSAADLAAWRRLPWPSGTRQLEAAAVTSAGAAALSAAVAAARGDTSNDAAAEAEEAAVENAKAAPQPPLTGEQAWRAAAEAVEAVEAALAAAAGRRGPPPSQAGFAALAAAALSTQVGVPPK